jgi:chromate transporter
VVRKRRIRSRADWLRKLHAIFRGGRLEGAEKSRIAAGEGERAAALAPRAPSFGEAFRYWLRLGFINFGGPTGQIATMHEDLVENRRWISNERFLHALNYCMLLPGPEAQQLAVYIGWLLHRARGGLVAGTLFILPGFTCILALSWIYAAHGEVPQVAAVFYGLRAAVIGIVAAATIRIGSSALKNRVSYAIAALAFVGTFFFKVPFPFLVIGAATVGFLGSGFWPGAFAGVRRHGAGSPAVIRDDGPSAEHTRPTLGRAARVLAVGLLCWWGPLAAVLVLRGRQDVLSEEAVFFSKAAMITFGGAYAVLAYINQAAVEVYRWITWDQAVTGLGLAESTPGPLIMVTEFVGFLGAYQRPGGLEPWVAGVLGATVTTWATFAPCFLWIFLGAPFIEVLRGNRKLDAALSAITAAVVGVILSLAVWFGIKTLFARHITEKIFGLELPVLSSLDPFAFLLALVVFFGVWRLRWKIVPVVLASAGVGLVWKTVF